LPRAPALPALRRPPCEAGQPHRRGPHADEKGWRGTAAQARARADLAGNGANIREHDVLDLADLAGGLAIGRGDVAMGEGTIEGRARQAHGDQQECSACRSIAAAKAPAEN
jgi:hypothetical protein